MANTYFTDRVVQYPGRVTMTPTGNTNEYDLARAEGDVTKPGTPFNADTFNGIANQILQDAINAAVARAVPDAVNAAVAQAVPDAVTKTLAKLGDYVTEKGTSGNWKYRKWKSGKIEAWGSYSFSAKQGTAWTGGLYYSDETVPIPSGIFTATPRKYVTSNSSQWSPHSAWGSGTTSMTIRFAKPNANKSDGASCIYLVQD